MSLSKQFININAIKWFAKPSRIPALVVIVVAAVTSIGCDDKRQPFAVRQTPGIYGQQASPFYTRDDAMDGRASGLSQNLGLAPSQDYLGNRGRGHYYTDDFSNLINSKVPGADEYWPFVDPNVLYEEEKAYNINGGPDYDDDGLPDSIEIEAIIEEGPAQRGGTDTHPLIANKAVVAAAPLDHDTFEKSIYNTLKLDYSAGFTSEAADKVSVGRKVLTTIRDDIFRKTENFLRMDYDGTVPNHLRSLLADTYKRPKRDGSREVENYDMAKEWPNFVAFIDGGIGQQVGESGLEGGEINEMVQARERRNFWKTRGGYLQVTQFRFFTHKSTNVSFSFFKRQGKHKDEGGYGGGAILLKDGSPIVNTAKADELVPDMKNIPGVGPIISVGGIVDNVLEGVAQGVWGVFKNIGYDDDEILVRTSSKPYKFNPGVENGADMVLIQYITNPNEVEELVVDMDAPPGGGKGDGRGFEPIPQKNIQWYYDGWFDLQHGGYKKYKNEDNNLVFFIDSPDTGDAKGFVTRYRNEMAKVEYEVIELEPETPECSKCKKRHDGDCSKCEHECGDECHEHKKKNPEHAICGVCGQRHAKGDCNWLTLKQIERLLRHLEDLRDTISDDVVMAGIQEMNKSCGSENQVINVSNLRSTLFNPSSSVGLIQDAIVHIRDKMLPLYRALNQDFIDPNVDAASLMDKEGLRRAIVADINLFYKRYFTPLKLELAQIDRALAQRGVSFIRDAAYTALDNDNVPGFEVREIESKQVETDEGFTGTSVQQWTLIFNDKSAEQKINNVYQFDALLDEIGNGNYRCR